MASKLKKVKKDKKTDLKGHKIVKNQSAPKTEMDNKIEAAMNQIVGETLKDKHEWETTYKKENKKSSKSKSSGGKKKIFKRTMAGIGVVILLLGIAYGGGAFYYKDKFFKGTEINNIVCENMSAEEAEKLIKATAEDYSIKINFKEDKSEIIDGKDIKYTYISDGKVEKLLKEQNPLLWIKGYYKQQNYEIGGEMEFDEAMLSNKLNSFASMKEENMTAPENAYIAFENNQFVIKDEVVGTTIGKEVLLSKVKESIDKGERQISVEEAGAYILPTVKNDDEKLNKQKDVWNNCAAVTVTYTFGDQKEVLDGMTVKDWMTYDEEGNYVENPAVLEENIRAYVAGLGEKYNTVGKTRTIVSTATGQPVTVEGGSYGFMIDSKAEREQLLADIQGHANTTREPVYARKAKAYGENDIGNTYVEVDLTSQRLWYYKDGKMLMSSNFVSGTYYNKGRRTPGGSYYLYYKQRNQVLRPAPNPDGSYDYESPVAYWMPFNGGIGFHDANWRGSFGGSIYLYGGSHGCINLPVSFAGGFYNSIEAGCPIICFYR